MDARPVAIGVKVYGQSATKEDMSMMDTKSVSDVLTSQTFWLAVIGDTVENAISTFASCFGGLTLAVQWANMT